jgi:hypothetical protein
MLLDTVLRHHSGYRRGLLDFIPPIMSRKERSFHILAATKTRIALLFQRMACGGWLLLTSSKPLDASKTHYTGQRT